MSKNHLISGASSVSVKDFIVIQHFALIKKQGDWKTDATVWGYINEGRQFADNVAHPLIEKVSQLLGRKNYLKRQNG